MPITVCLAANCIHYPQQLWPYLNWALSLRRAGCEVIWLESLEDDPRGAWLGSAITTLSERLAPYGLAAAVVLVTEDGRPVEPVPRHTLPLAAALEADVLLDLAYLPPELVRGFRRTVFVDLDPGQTQIWAAEGDLDISGHHIYISIGEGVESPGRRFPDAGHRWVYVPTPVALNEWESLPAPGDGAPYTTISHWWDSMSVEIDGEWVESSKQAGFEPLLTLPSLTSAPLELALGGLEDDAERQRLERLGWRVRNAEDVVATPEAYRDYVAGSRGEFSAAKPPYVLLESGWLNDRTASYLAAGRPAVVQRTIRRSDSRLPEGEGLLRFETVREAGAMLEAVQSDYALHARRARELAAEYFDGARVVTRVLELVLA
jgi:hypothetical protein